MTTTRTRNPLSGLSGCLIAALPLVVLLIGIAFLAEAVRFRLVALATQGEVVEMIRDTSGDGISYAPILKYRALDGRIYLGQTHISSSSYTYRIGDRVRILYDPEDPGEVRIDTFFSLYGLGAIFTALGGAFLLVLRLARRKFAGTASPPRHAESPGPGQRQNQPTTDPSRYGHVHKPKPKHQPTVRRMR